MYGNLLNSQLILRLLESGEISITPFDEGQLKAVHYPLRAQCMFKLDAPGVLGRAHSFDDDPSPCVIGPGEYFVVEVREAVLLGAGIVGQFVPASNLIEQGFGLTAGRLEHPFGQKGEKLRFGLKNLLDQPNPWKPADLLAYLQLFDLRGLSSGPVKMSERDVAVFQQRMPGARAIRAEDDGVFYPETDGDSEDPFG